jgi:hypothetical protein
LGFRKDNPNVFNMLVQNLPHCQRHKMHMLLILLALCLRKSDGISHLFSIAYAFAGNGWLRIEHVNNSVKRCRIVKDRIRLWKQGVRDLVMELCCALHNFRVRLTPWQPMI